MYDTPHRLSYNFNGVAFNGADITRVIKNPRKGSKGKVRSILAMVTTTCDGAISKPRIQVGDGVTATKYADVSLGATPAGYSVIGRDSVGGITAITPGAFVMTAVDGDLTVTFKAALGAGAAGVADCVIEVEWD